MQPINPAYVIAPFQQLLRRCQNNVLLGLRIVERTDGLPAPTAEELTLFQLSFGGIPSDFEHARKDFKNWIVRTGLRDVLTAIRTGLERTLVYETVRAHLATTDAAGLEAIARARGNEASRMHFPELVKAVEAEFDVPFDYLVHAESYNSVRNCLEHTHGIVTDRHCNDPGRTKITMHGHRFKLFFSKDGIQIPAHMGVAGPLNAALMLGAERFDIDFKIGDSIDLSLKNFLDVLNTCLFISADIGSHLKAA